MHDLNKKYKIVDILSADIKDIIEEEDFEAIGRKVVEDFDADKSSRAGWEKKMEACRKLAQQVWEQKTWPWNNAANVKFPLVSIASIQFAARAYPSLINGTEVVTHRVIGEDPLGLKSARADRISSHMNWQVLEQDEGWEAEMDRGLHMLPIWGNFFKKVYFDENAGHVKSVSISPYNLVLPYYGDWESCRKTMIHQFSGRQIVENQKLGIYRDIELEQPPSSVQFEEQREAKSNRGLEEVGENIDEYRMVLEQHTYCDLDGDGYAEPYVVVVDYDTAEVLDMSARFTVRDITCSKKAEVDALFRQFEANLNPQDPVSMQNAVSEYDMVEGMAVNLVDNSEIYKIKGLNHFVKFSFIPSFDESVYDIGFGILLGPTNEAVNTLINQLIDSGTLQNSSSGFIGKGAKVRGGSLSFEPYEWKRMDTFGGDLKNNIVPLPVNPPSAVLFEMLQLLISYGERLSSVSDLMQGVTPGQNTPATTSMAALEQGQKVFSSIFKRVYRGLKKEMETIYKLNRDTLDPVKYFAVVDSGDTAQIFAADYFGDSTDIAPAADPSAASTELRRARAEFLAQRAASIPGYKQYEVEKKLLEEYEISGIELLYPDPEGPNALPPPSPSLELQIKAQEAEAKVMKAKADTQAVMAKLEVDIAKTGAEIAELEAKAQKAQTEAALNIVKGQLEGKRLALDKIKVYRESLQTMLDYADREEGRKLEKEKLDNDKQQAKATPKSS